MPRVPRSLTDIAPFHATWTRHVIASTGATGKHGTTWTTSTIIVIAVVAGKSKSVDKTVTATNTKMIVVVAVLLQGGGQLSSIGSTRNAGMTLTTKSPWLPTQTAKRNMTLATTHVSTVIVVFGR
jgi:hypothetical protein